MATTPNLGLTTWGMSDPFDVSALAANFTKLDAQFSPVGVFTTPVRFVEQVSSLPAFGTQGRLIFTQNATGGFAANQLLRDTGSGWANVGPLEIQNSLPVSSNFQGRAILLSTAVSGFPQWSIVINTDGANTWQSVGQVSTSATVNGFSNNFAGKLGVLTAADSNFSAWTLLVYNGTSWQSTETRGVLTQGTLPSSPYQGQVLALTSQVQPFVANDIVNWDGSKWRRVSNPPLTTMAQFTAMTSVTDGLEIILQADQTNNIEWRMRYNSSVATWPWEFIGGNPQKFFQSSSDSISTSYTQLGSVQLTISRSGVYWFEFGASFSNPTIYPGMYFVGLSGGPLTPSATQWGGYIPGNDGTSMVGQTEHTTISAGTTITLQARNNQGSGSASFNAFIRAHPVKINQS